jgi:predicted phosphoadenosine phosphosulfate sulfurtransferase
MLHLVMDECKKRNRKIGVLFIDWEVQYKLTIQHVEGMFELYKEWIVPYWVALPMTTESVVSQYEPEWISWDQAKKDLWVRQSPDFAIKDESFFPFYRHAMQFEEFILDFGNWYAQKDSPEWSSCYEPTVGFVGIRTDESLNRLLKLSVGKNRTHYNGNRWMLNLRSTHFDIIMAHPIYDWKTQDIWTYNGKFFKPYNLIYDLMHKAGVPISKQRIDEFFGSAARRGLWVLHSIEPDTWAKVTGRITGCNSGALYARDSGSMTGDRKISKPEGHTWKSFASLLLHSMPDKTSEHYQNKIAIYLKWYYNRGYPSGLPDEEDGDLETKDKHPSWRRICKVLLKGDYWCKALSFTPTKGSSYERYLAVMRNRRAKWGTFW